jgi:hypothetical protein
VTKDVGGGQTQIVKERRDSPRKIDIAVAMVIAYDRATSKDLTRRSVYETRGMLFVETGHRRRRPDRPRRRRGVRRGRPDPAAATPGERRVAGR